MHLKSYLKSLTAGQKKVFANACQTNLPHLKQIAGGWRPCRESLAINIERESGAKVSCEELRPDVDWAYLRNTKPAKSKKRIAA
jgi:DNA-binding transcriptional regulator YdaS (Cro superfamily)